MRYDSLSSLMPSSTSLGLHFGSHGGSPAIIQQARTTTAAFFFTLPLTCPCRFARWVLRGHLGAEREHTVVGCPSVCTCVLAKPLPVAVLPSKSSRRASMLHAICSPSRSASCSGSPSKLHKHLVDLCGSRMFVAWLVFSPVLVRFVAIGGPSNDGLVWHISGAGGNGCACSPRSMRLGPSERCAVTTWWPT